MRVAVIGVGRVVARTASAEMGYKEMRFFAARQAYADARLSPNDIDTFVSCMEDVTEGTSITDEYVPDQLGAVLRPVHTIAGDGLQGVACGCQQVLTGKFQTCLVESYSKASNLKKHAWMWLYAMEPTYNRPLGLNPIFIAGLQMRRYMEETKTTERHCASVVVKNRGNAIYNPGGAWARLMDIEEVLASAAVAEPLKELDCAGFSDGAAAVVLASEKFVRDRKIDPDKVVWITGISYNNDSYYLESREWGRVMGVARAAESAYKQAGISDPRTDLDFFEVDDTFSYRELMHLEALGLYEAGRAGEATEAGETHPDGRFPVNPSGGWLGMGLLHECSGLYRLVEAVLQLRGEAGPHQLKRTLRRGVVQSWRGLPVETCAVCVLEK